MSQLLYLFEFYRDSFAKYAAHFLAVSSSSFASAYSLRSRANSISVSVGGRCPYPTFGSLPDLVALTQLPKLLFGIESRFAA